MKILTINSVKGVLGLLLLVLSMSMMTCLRNPPAAPAAGPKAASPATSAAAPSSQAPVEGALKENQITAFPNSAEAPTMPSRVGTNNYHVPKLSASLYESDPTRKLRKSEFMEVVKYALYKLTRGELEQIFHFVDQNKDELVDHMEWTNFSRLFIFPFEACDKNGDYILDEKEFGACFDSDPKSKTVEFRRRYKEKKHSLMMTSVSTRGVTQNNFADYLFIRKALFGWQQCHSNAKYIAKSHFKCALGASIPQKYYNSMDFEKIYNTGMRLAADRNLIELDFISYLRVLYYTYVFGIFNLPADTANLEKSQFLKAIKEDRLPNNWEESEVDTIYDLINNSPTMHLNKVSTIDFESWAFFFNLHHTFNMYSQARPLQLKKDEFLKMLDDPFMNKEIIIDIDYSFTKFTQAQYQESSLALQRYRLNEKDFFFARFKQDASAKTAATFNPSTVNNNYYEIKPNQANREIFFTSFCSLNKEFWTKTDMYRAFLLANLYVELTDYKDQIQGAVVPVSAFLDKMPTLYDTIKPPINMWQRSNYAIYKALPREISLDMLTFLALENFYTKFHIKTMSSSVTVNETTVKIILKDYGMENMPDTVIDTAQKGYDSLRRRQYVPLELAKATIVAQGVASEQHRVKFFTESLKLPVNNDPSRQYPAPPRRFMSSDKV